MSGVTAQRDDWERLWDDYADSAKANPAQALRRRLVFSWLALDRATAPLRVLDIGSGQGDFAAELRARFPNVDILGLELSQSGVEIARRKVPSARFVQRDLLAASDPEPTERAWATHAVCAEVLEHVDDPDAFLRHVAAYLAPAGRLIVTVPGGPMSAFDRHIGHRRHFRPAEVRRLLEATGFVVERVTGAGFPFFNLYRLVVVARGPRLIADVARDSGSTSRLARLVMATFGVLFRLTLPASPWGWQLVAVARRS